MELSGRKVIVFMILIFVVIIVGMKIESLLSFTHSNLNTIDEKTCSYNPQLFLNKFYNCDIHKDCTDKERTTWKNAKEYLGNKNCSDLSQNCSCIQNIIFNIKNEKSNSNSNNNDNNNNNNNGNNQGQNSVNTGIKNCNVLKTCTQKERVEFEKENQKSIQRVKNFLSSDFYKNHKSVFEKYANSKGINVNILYAIVINEGAYNGGITNNVRFECHKFNGKSSKKVPCTIGKKGFSTVPSETNYNAYLNAKKINPKLAFESSSFGFPQIMGFNYENLGMKVDYNKGIGNLDFQTQFNFFTKFLERNGVLKYIKSQDWNEIAKKYNGGGYSKNDYNTKIALNYENLGKSLNT